MKISVKRGEPVGNPVLVSEVKEHLRIDHHEENEHLLRIAQAAVQQFEHLGQVAVIKQQIEVTAINPVYHFPLPIGPLSDIASLTVTADGVQQLNLEMAPGFSRDTIILWCLHDVPEGAVWKFQYMAGLAEDRSTVPADIKLAIMDQAALLYDGRAPFHRKDLEYSPHMVRIAARYRGVRL